MTRTVSPKLGAYAGLAALGLIAAIALRRPELVAVTAPFPLVLAVGLAFSREPDLRAQVALDRERVLEDDEVVLTLTLRAAEPLERVEVFVRLPPALVPVDGANPFALRLGTSEATRELRLHCGRWGGYALGEAHLRIRDRFGLFVHEQQLTELRPLRVYPRPEEIRRVLPPLETQVYSGNQVSRGKGEGIEFADIRPFATGDRVRRINWRVSARRGELFVNERHPERNTDVIIFLDSFTEARASQRGTLELAVRAAASLAALYLQRKDRVGLVSFGGVLSWLLPATGLVQRYRILDSVIGTEIVFSYAWKDADVIPVGTLPPQALILALTPLLDERAIATLLDLRARGFDLAVIEVSPLPFAAAAEDEAEAIGHRLWQLRRETLRSRYQRLGVPVVEWRDGDPLAVALEEVGAFRRQAGRVRA
ncbi:MAG: hypothetical protein QOG29_1463 [Gaiellaceae bacterium]|nr:hypothetical protein [Gaiellaceae bacterium]MDX6488016.1 hypothetical protein [Gaiellaceae bacterium]MDX6510268.1 hypothetical protein [Gaiellaceae bacterium]